MDLPSKNEHLKLFLKEFGIINRNGNTAVLCVLTKGSPKNKYNENKTIIQNNIIMYC